MEVHPQLSVDQFLASAQSSSNSGSPSLSAPRTPGLDGHLPSVLASQSVLLPFWGVEGEGQGTYLNQQSELIKKNSRMLKIGKKQRKTVMMNEQKSEGR